MPTITLPRSMRSGVGPSGATVATDAHDLAGVFRHLHELAPAVALQIFDQNERLKKNIVLVLNGEVVRPNAYPALRFSPGDDVLLLLQFAGG